MVIAAGQFALPPAPSLWEGELGPCVPYPHGSMTDESTSSPASVPSTERWRVLLLIAFVALALFKLALVSHHEILVWGFDDAGYARAGEVGYWGEPYGQYTHTRQPVYPLFLTYSRDLGVPARLAIELVWIGACWVLVRAVRVCGANPLVALGAGALALFHPWTIIWFDRLSQDNLYAPLVIAFLASIAACIVEPVKKRAWRWGALVAASGALAANTRPEAILLYGTLALSVVISLSLWACRLSDRRTVRRDLLAAFLVPLLAMQGLTLYLAHENKRHIGVAVTTDFMLPGIKRLYSALLAIPPEPDAPGSLPGGGHDPRLPITRDVREKAYAVSPTLATLRPWLDGEKRMKEFARGCFKQTGVSDEFGAWTVWALRKAAWKSRRAQVRGGWHSARELSDFYGRAADEVRAAMADGRLRRRAVPVPFMPPEWGTILTRWPRSLRATWALMADLPYQRMYSQKGAVRMTRMFNAVALRRTVPATLAEGPDAVVRGSAWFSPERVEASDRFGTELAGVYRPIVRTSLWTALAGVLVGWGGLFIRSGRLARGVLRARWYVLTAILGTALLARVLLISLLDVTGLPVLERYLIVCGPLLTALGLMGLQGLIAYGAVMAFGRRGPKAERAFADHAD